MDIFDLAKSGAFLSSDAGFVEKSKIWENEFLDIQDIDGKKRKRDVFVENISFGLQRKGKFLL